MHLKDIASWTTGPSSKWFYRIVPCDALNQNCTNGSTPPSKGACQSARWEITVSSISSWTTGPNSNQFHRIVPHDALKQTCKNVYTLQNKRAARALDKKYLLATSPPEPLVQIQNYFTDMFLMMPSTKLAQMVTLCRTKGLPEL